MRALLVLFALQAPACSGASKVDGLRLVTSGRDGFQRPECVIEALGIQGDAPVESLDFLVRAFEVFAPERGE